MATEGPRSSAPAWPAGRIAAWLAKQVELALAVVELSPPQYRLLGLLGDGDALPSALADRLAVRPPTVTAVVDGLVARGMVERHPGDGDRRRVSHVLTPEGRRVLADADAAVDTRLRDLTDCLGDPELTLRALDGLALWGRAMGALHARKAAAR